MHQSSLDDMTRFRDSCLSERDDLTKCDIGSQNTDGWYRPVFAEPSRRYIGIYMTARRNVDVVLRNSLDRRNAVILSRARIGDRAALGTEAAVTKNISHYALAVGSPARLVKLRFYIESIHQLSRVRWREWPDERIANALPLLLDDNLLGFLKAVADSMLFNSGKFSTNWSLDIDKEPR